jgi:GTP:adenosylcobinamide-phosphate guanylyltransferase
MKALILNSGLGRRMGVLTSEHPKCMTEVSAQETILSRQLHQIAEAGIEEVVMTTGLFDQVLEQYCKSLDLPLAYTFVKNPVYDKTNYIYSIYCAREKLIVPFMAMAFLKRARRTSGRERSALARFSSALYFSSLEYGNSTSLPHGIYVLLCGYDP